MRTKQDEKRTFVKNQFTQSIAPLMILGALFGNFTDWPGDAQRIKKMGKLILEVGRIRDELLESYKGGVDEINRS